MCDSIMTRVSELYIVQSILDFSVIVIAYSFKRISTKESTSPALGACQARTENRKQKTLKYTPDGSKLLT